MVETSHFVEVWMQAFLAGHNQTWIADQLELSRQRVSNRADQLRSRGVKLPRLKMHVRPYKSSKPLSVDEVAHLNEFITNKIKGENTVVVAL